MHRKYNRLKLVRFEVSTAVTMMIIIFWEMTPCGSYKNRRHGVISQKMIIIRLKLGGGQAYDSSAD
jgi:hypothetical protein